MTNMILIGFMGAGKTTVGLQLSKKLNLPFLDTDQRIEEEQKRAISDIFANEGEAYFRSLETKQLEKLIQEINGSVISVGGGLPVQKVNHDLLKKLGTTVYLKAKKDTLIQRLQGDTSRPLLQGGELEERIENLMNAREAIYEQVADVVVETDEKTLENVIAELSALIQ